MKRLFRSKTDRMLAGVCGGLAKYFNVDPVLVRVLAVISLLIFNVLAFIAYIVMIIIVPLEDSPAANP